MPCQEQRAAYEAADQKLKTSIDIRTQATVDLADANAELDSATTALNAAQTAYDAANSAQNDAQDGLVEAQQGVSTDAAAADAAYDAWLACVRNPPLDSRSKRR